MSSLRCRSACSRPSRVPSHSAIRSRCCIRHVACRSSSYRDQFEEKAPRDAGEASTSEPREDDVLPDNLIDSLKQGAQATADAIKKGVPRSIVEILLPEFWDPMSGAVFAEEGDQMRFWQLGKRFTDELIDLTGSKDVTVIFPDFGVASYLKHTWGDAAPFAIQALGEKQCVTGEEDLVVVVAADPQGAEEVVRVNRLVPQHTPLVLFNPRLVSGDVGIGLNVRRLRSQFLGQFITTYSIRPIDDIGTIYRRYPSLWKVFIQDETMPGRYKLIAERPDRPAGDGLDYLIMEAMNEDAGGEGVGPLQQLTSTLGSVQRFMKSLSS